MKQSVIQHVPKMHHIKIHRDYVEMLSALSTGNSPCPDSRCSAAILSVFEYWMNYKTSENEQHAYHNTALEKGGKTPMFEIDMWIYKTQEQLKSEDFPASRLRHAGH